MALWKLHLRPEGIDPQKVVDCCIKNKIAGIGWHVDRKPKDADCYAELAYKKYGRSTPSIRFAKDIQCEDLIWMRSIEGIYYLGQIKGDWEYKESDLGIQNQRECHWEEIGIADTVPGRVQASFNAPLTFHHIWDKSIEEFSKWLYKPKTKRNFNKINIPKDESAAQFFFKLIGHLDCEDIVALYLQQERGYFIIPSSCTKDMISTEFILIHKDSGEKAAVQVKQGNVDLEADDLKKGADQVFLFTTEGSTPEDEEKVETLNKEELFKFCQNNKKILPEKISNWMEFIGQD